MSEPMSDERLARIRERAVRAACGKHKDDGWLFCRIDAPDLLAEVERLKEALDMATTGRDHAEDLAVILRAELEAAKRDVRDMLRESRLLSDYDLCVWCERWSDTHEMCCARDCEIECKWRGVPANTPAQGDEKGGTE